jgi:hypothetical protein
MTPYKHAESSCTKWGGIPEDYIDLHQWFDETKQLTGNWTHRALRHHAQGVEQSILVFGHHITNSHGKKIPVKLLSEQHVTEDCGYIPTVQDWFKPLLKNPDSWMLKVGKIQQQTLEVK